jgi:hypothetical protein
VVDVAVGAVVVEDVVDVVGSVVEVDGAVVVAVAVVVLDNVSVETVVSVDVLCTGAGVPASTVAARSPAPARPAASSPKPTRFTIPVYS